MHSHGHTFTLHSTPVLCLLGFTSKNSKNQNALTHGLKVLNVKKHPLWASRSSGEPSLTITNLNGNVGCIILLH